MTPKERVIQIWNQHIALATNCTDGGRVFRKTVREQLMAEFVGMTDSAASTNYNIAKLAHEAINGPIAGLGRAAVPKTARKISNKAKPDELQPDDECFAVIQLLPNGSVGRCQTFLAQGDASEHFDSKIVNWPNSSWVMIQGLGPLHGESFKLDAGEKEIKRYTTNHVAVPKAAYVKPEDADGLI